MINITIPLNFNPSNHPFFLLFLPNKIPDINKDIIIIIIFNMLNIDDVLINRLILKFFNFFINFT